MLTKRMNGKLVNLITGQLFIVAIIITSIITDISPDVK